MPMVDRQASGAGHSERTVIFPVFPYCPRAATQPIGARAPGALQVAEHTPPNVPTLLDN